MTYFWLIYPTDFDYFVVERFLEGGLELSQVEADLNNEGLKGLAQEADLHVRIELVYNAGRQLRDPIVDLRLVRGARPVGGHGGGVDRDGGAVSRDGSDAEVAAPPPHLGRPEKAVRPGLLDVEDRREFVVGIQPPRLLDPRILSILNCHVQPRRDGDWILPVKNLPHHGGARRVHVGG